MSNTPPFHGIIPPVVTPLVDADQLDVAGLERLLEHLLAGGVHGLFMLGTTGEAPSLTSHLQREVIDRTCRIVKGRVPVLVGISNTSLTFSVEMAQFAAEAGCQAGVSAAPYYMPMDQSELVGYFRQLVARVPLPLVLYNFPLLTKVEFEPESVADLLHEENIVGMKDSSGDLDYFAKIVAVAKERPGFSVLAGKEANLGNIIDMGGHGGVTGGANVAPKLFVDLYQAAIAGDGGHVDRLVPQVLELGKIYGVAGTRFSAGIAGIKTALELMKICSGKLAPPIPSVSDQQRLEIKKILASLTIA